MDALALDFFTSPDGLICLVAGAIVGGLASQLIASARGLELVRYIVLGIVGGMIGGYVFDLINIIDIGDTMDPLIAGVIGAAVLLVIFRALRR